MHTRQLLPCHHGKLSPGTPASLTPVPICPHCLQLCHCLGTGLGRDRRGWAGLSKEPFGFMAPRLHKQFAQLSKMPPIVDQKGLAWALPPTCTVPSSALQMLMGCGGGCLQTRGCLQWILLAFFALINIHQTKLRAMCPQWLQVFGPQLLRWIQHCWSLGVLTGRTREGRKWGNVKTSEKCELDWMDSTP